MTLAFTCHNCGKQLVAKASHAGKEKTCPECGAAITVPSSADSGLPQPVASKAAASHSLVLAPSSPRGHDDLIDMTAMVDIVFFLLIFFMVTSIQALQSVIDLPTPQAPGSAVGAQAEPDYANDPSFVIVTIEADDTIWVDDEQVFGAQDLRDKLRLLRDQDVPPSGMLVLGDPEASHGTLVTVLDAGADVGMEDLRFSVTQELDLSAG